MKLSENEWLFDSHSNIGDCRNIFRIFISFIFSRRIHLSFDETLFLLFCCCCCWFVYFCLVCPLVVDFFQWDFHILCKQNTKNQRTLVNISLSLFLVFLICFIGNVDVNVNIFISMSDAPKHEILLCLPTGHKVRMFSIFENLHFMQIVFSPCSVHFDMSFSIQGTCTCAFCQICLK